MTKKRYIAIISSLFFLLLLLISGCDVISYSSNDESQFIDEFSGLRELNSKIELVKGTFYTDSVTYVELFRIKSKDVDAHQALIDSGWSIAAYNSEVEEGITYWGRTKKAEGEQSDGRKVHRGGYLKSARVGEFWILAISDHHFTDSSEPVWEDIRTYQKKYSKMSQE